MPRYRSAEAESAAQDSFLDVVTNIVGILIILVMVIGGRVQQLVFEPVAPDDSQAAALEREIETLEATVAIADVGPLGRDAVPALGKALRHEKAYLRTRAAGAARWRSTGSRGGSGGYR